MQMKPVDFAILFVGLLAVSFADVLIKKVCHNQENVWDALQSPLMLGVLVLYAMQITAFVYVFVRKAELGVVGIAQTVIYAIIVIGSGMLFFNESLTPAKGVGAALAVVGVVLMNRP